MKVLYIGHYDHGSTSRMRGEYLKQLLSPELFHVVNIDIPLAETSAIFRSLGWRFKVGPLIRNINNYIQNSLKRDYSYDLVWIDKGVFISPEIIARLRSYSKKLIHFTPDPAFAYHRSHLFYEALPQYDYCVTTKSFELGEYKRYGVKTILTTQGYDPHIHKSYHQCSEKSGVVFIGHKEEEREYIISKLLEAKVSITLAGNHWEQFAKKHNNGLLRYKGKGIFGEEYAKTISGALMGLGLLSRWVPELHTTRTFEIPACRTVLVTERNAETTALFQPDEVVFYDCPDSIVEVVLLNLSDASKLRETAERGSRRVVDGGYSYPEILKSILKQTSV